MPKDETQYEESFVDDTVDDLVNEVFEENFDDVFEETLLPNGEHELIILSMKMKAGKKHPERRMIAVTFEATQEETASEIRDFVLFENASLGDTIKTANRFKTKRMNFYIAFNIDTSSGMSQAVCDESIGNTGFAILNTDDDPKYGKQNRVREYSAGK